jgi:hypothetical protein
VAVTIGKRTIVLPSPFELVNRELMTFEALAAFLRVLQAGSGHDQPQWQSGPLAYARYVHAQVVV